MKPKKSLGQNFLKGKQALRKIIEAGEIKKDDFVLEIGPGKGALTKKLLDNNCTVLAIEKDRDLIPMLEKKFKKEILSGQLKLICEDILDFNLGDYKLKPKNYKIIANIPYNITGAILKKFLENENNPKKMVLMVQHEIAKRIMATDKKESILSISVKVYGTPKYIMKVGARYFSPPPRVDSAIISIENISKDIFKKNNIDEKFFWEIIHSGFIHKRKKLSSNLKIFLKNKKGGINSSILSIIKSLENKRAEELTLKDWIKIAKMI